MQHDRAAEDAGHGSGEGSLGEEARVHGRMPGRQLEADEEEADGQDGDPGDEGDRPRTAADRDQERADHRRQERQPDEVQGARGGPRLPVGAGCHWVARPARAKAEPYGAKRHEGHGNGHEEEAPPAEGADEEAPDERPAAALVDTRRSKSPKASPRRAGGAASRMSDAELVETNAPLTACRTRPAWRRPKDVATAATAEAAAKTRTPARKSRRWPNRSPREPLAGRATATAPRYRVTSEATGPAPRWNSSMIPGRATASIVELSGTRIEPLATPSMSGVRRRSPARRSREADAGHRRWTVPVVPSISSCRPSAIRVVASPAPTTAGSPNSRATTAACDRIPPVFVTRPAAIVNTGTQDGFEEGQTMMSPARIRPKSDGLEGDPGGSPDDARRGAGSEEHVGVGRGDRRAVEAIRAALPRGAPR